MFLGNLGRSHPNQFHSTGVPNADFVATVWWGVKLKSPSKTMSIKFYARRCCTLTGYGGELSIWMANNWPSDETDWKDWSQKSSAVLCKKFLVTDSATVDITCVGSTSYSYVFVRPTKIGTGENFLHIPEIIIKKFTPTSPTSCSPCSKLPNGNGKHVALDNWDGGKSARVGNTLERIIDDYLQDYRGDAGKIVSKPATAKTKSEIVSEYGPIEDWDVSEVTNMDYAFCYKKLFEGDLSRWDVSRVTKMAQSK